MKLTLRKLKEWNACYEGYNWFEQTYGGKSVDHITVLDELAYCHEEWNRFCDSNIIWLISKVFKHSPEERKYLHLTSCRSGHKHLKEIYFHNKGHTEFISLEKLDLDKSYLLDDLFKLHPGLTVNKIKEWLSELA